MDAPAILAKMRAAMIGLAFVVSACSGSAPSSPTPTPTPVPTPTPAPTATLTGHVTATNGGQGLPDLAVDLNGRLLATDGAGTFSATVTPGGTLRAAVTGSAIVPRTVFIGSALSRDVAIDAFTVGGGFDWTFYRELVRNTVDAPTTMEPLRRWTRTPQIYLKTVDEAGEAIDGPTLDVIEAAARDIVPRWSNGVLGTPTIVRGPDTRVGVSGWITIRFPATVTVGVCGQAQVATDGGWVELTYHFNPDSNCRTPGYVIAPRSVRHELGHALGFWHTDSPNDLMRGGAWSDPNQQPSARELYHAALAYRRPVGNIDPDQDPASTITLAPSRIVP